MLKRDLQLLPYELEQSLLFRASTHTTGPSISIILLRTEFNIPVKLKLLLVLVLVMFELPIEVKALLIYIQ